MHIHGWYRNSWWAMRSIHKRKKIKPIYTSLSQLDIAAVKFPSKINWMPERGMQRTGLWGKLWCAPLQLAVSGSNDMLYVCHFRLYASSCQWICISGYATPVNLVLGWSWRSSLFARNFALLSRFGSRLRLASMHISHDDARCSYKCMTYYILVPRTSYIIIDLSVSVLLL